MATSPIAFYVSPNGRDTWSGGRPDPNSRGTDGPFATLPRAARAVRALKKKGALPAPVRVYLRGGTYFLKRPFVLTSQDSGTQPQTWWSKVQHPAHDVTYMAYGREKPVVSGGKRITGWKETLVNGKRAFTASIPTVKAGRWNFHQLWVNGRRARRTRLPEKGLFRIAELPDAVFEESANSHKNMFTGQDRFIYAEGDLAPWRNIEDVEFVCLHYWIDSRINFRKIDPAKHTATLQWKPKMRLSEDPELKSATYYVENVPEALRKPGQWYLDRPTGRITYLPRRGETIERMEAIAPIQEKLLCLEGEWREEKPVQWINFKGITFAHNEWYPDDPTDKLSIQAAFRTPGAVELLHAHNCRFERCRIEHTETYAVELRDGCMDVTLSHCNLTDLGAGGVKIWHTLAEKMDGHTGGGQKVATSSQRITVSDCVIADGSHRHHQAVGVLIGKCSGNKILHNHIHGFDYTGISVGWTWGYAESGAYGNIIEFNHVHDIGRGMLSDMGGIYTLGVSPGTRIRHNVFHDITSRTYGGWAIYTDEGSTDILIENNLAYRTNRQGFHQHYGKNNTVRNNIFAFGGEGQIARGRLEAHCSFVFTNNIILADNDDGNILTGDWKENGAVMNHNLYWHMRRRKMDFDGGTFRQWQQRGMDRQSIVADPGFEDPAAGDFTLRKDSPAARIGFVPFDFSRVGPRR